MSNSFFVAEKENLKKPLQPGIRCDTSGPAAFGNRLAVHFMQVGGEVDRGGTTDIAADAETVNRGT
jgi:hypothetical protein